MLLREAQIPFKLVTQDADETSCDWGLQLSQLVEQIALHKMNHAILPSGKNDGDICFVLTADTMPQDSTGTIHGKPINREDAIEKIKAARECSQLFTAFCLDKKIWRNNAWHLEKRIQRCVHAEYQFVIPDHWIDVYLEKSMGLKTSGAIAVEGFGSQFLKMVHGSYTTIIGLPMFEVREALEEIDFFHCEKAPNKSAPFL